MWRTRHDRGEATPRLFALKAWLAGAGTAVGLVGIVVGLRWPVWIAVGLLSGAFLVRFAERADRAR